MKNLIKTNKKIYLFAKVLRLILASSYIKIDGSKKKYPKVLQLPITYKCNGRCVMCNIWKMDHSNEATIEEFTKFLKDPIFKKVKSVGINGGEPSLIPDLPKYANEILKLPMLKSLNIISNGFNQYPLLKSLEKIYESCLRKGIKFHVVISLDGVGEIHNKVRGRTNAFEKTISTIDKIIENQDKYCNSFDLSCTVTKQNVDYLEELDSYAKFKNYNIKYRLGIENKRIGSDKLKDKYSVIYTTGHQSAKEFFHYQIFQAKSFIDKFTYFSIFYWLNTKKPKRLLGCQWKDEGITLDSRGKLYYCAVASKEIGSLRKDSGENVFFKDKNIEYRKSIVNNSCDGCIHDYNGKLEVKNLIIFLKEIIFLKYNSFIYRCKSSLL